MEVKNRRKQIQKIEKLSQKSANKSETSKNSNLKCDSEEKKLQVSKLINMPKKPEKISMKNQKHDQKWSENKEILSSGLLIRKNQTEINFEEFKDDVGSENSYQSNNQYCFEEIEKNSKIGTQNDNGIDISPELNKSYQKTVYETPKKKHLQKTESQMTENAFISPIPKKKINRQMPPPIRMSPLEAKIQENYQKVMARLRKMDQDRPKSNFDTFYESSESESENEYSYQSNLFDKKNRNSKNQFKHWRLDFKIISPERAKKEQIESQNFSRSESKNKKQDSRWRQLIGINSLKNFCLGGYRKPIEKHLESDLKSLSDKIKRNWEATGLNAENDKHSLIWTKVFAGKRKKFDLLS